MILGIIVEVPANLNSTDLFKELLFFGWENNLHVAFEVADPTPTEQLATYAVTLLGSKLTPHDLQQATKAIADWGGNISRVVRLSRFPVFSYELHVSGGDVPNIRKQLLSAAAANPNMDIAFQTEGLIRRAKRLVAMDMDSTLIQDEVIDLLAEEAGCQEKVKVITELSMAGELDFTESLRKRVACLEGLEMAALERTWQRLNLTKGAQTFIRVLRQLGYRTALVSGGFTFFAEKLADQLQLDYTYANTLEIQDGRLTGRVLEPIVDRPGKAEFLRSLAEQEKIPLAQTVAIGDGANDLDMLETAGLGIAFCAKPLVRTSTDTSLNVPFLDAVLFFLGVSRQEIEQAN